MILRKSKARGDSIVVIGGCGKVGQSLIYMLTHFSSLSVTYYAKNFSQAARINACLQDCLSRNIEVSVDEKSIVNADVIIFAAGGRTSVKASKDSLYDGNKKILEEYFPLLYDKDVILVSNPCTKLGVFIEENISCRVYGAGVQNDFNRANYQNKKIDYIVGAHNIFEQCHYGVDDKIFYNGLLDSEEYKFSRLKQNEYLNLNLDRLLYEDLLQDEGLKWWKNQRYHSLKNSLAISCAKSIVDILFYLLGDGKKVHIETRVSLDDTHDVFIGLPVFNGKILCPHEILMGFLNGNSSYAKEYRISKY